MNPHQKPQEDVVVTQEDRDLAHEIMHHVRGYAVRLPSDRHWLIDLVTRHRLLGHEAGRRDMREAAGKALGEVVKHFDGMLNDKDWPETERIVRAALPTEPLGGKPPPDNSGPE